MRKYKLLPNTEFNVKACIATKISATITMIDKQGSVKYSPGDYVYLYNEDNVLKMAFMPKAEFIVLFMDNGNVDGNFLNDYCLDKRDSKHTPDNVPTSSRKLSSSDRDRDDDVLGELAARLEAGDDEDGDGIHGVIPSSQEKQGIKRFVVKGNNTHPQL
jgi:hypothetical protein